MNKERQYRVPGGLVDKLGSNPLTKSQIDKVADEDEMANNPEFKQWYAKFFKSTPFEKFVKAESINEELGLVLGYAIVCKETVEEGNYFDLQDDHIPDYAMLKAADDFMRNSRKVDDMHDESPIGETVFAWPMTEDIAKAFNIETKKFGLMIAVRPSPDVLEKFKTGEYTGFSIGGEYGETEFIDE